MSGSEDVKTRDRKERGKIVTRWDCRVPGGTFKDQRKEHVFQRGGRKFPLPWRRGSVTRQDRKLSTVLEEAEVRKG